MSARKIAMTARIRQVETPRLPGRVRDEVQSQCSIEEIKSSPKAVTALIRPRSAPFVSSKPRVDGVSSRYHGVGVWCHEHHWLTGTHCNRLNTGKAVEPWVTRINPGSAMPVKLTITALGPPRTTHAWNLHARWLQWLSHPTSGVQGHGSSFRVQT